MTWLEHAQTGGRALLRVLGWILTACYRLVAAPVRYALRAVLFPLLAPVRLVRGAVGFAAKFKVSLGLENVAETNSGRKK